MLELVRRSRGLGIAAVVLALSAGVALAASGPANLHPFLTGPNGADATEAAETAEPTDAPESEAPEASEAPNVPDAGGAPTDTHGALVSTAAQMPTPAGFSNHGAFVSCVARMKNVTLGTINWSTVTPKSCAAAQPGKSGSH
jgi:hypothetical protein